MNIIKGMQSVTPVVDEVIKYNKIRIAMAENKNDFENDRISKDKYNVNNEKHIYQFVSATIPFMVTVATLSVAMAVETYSGFQSGLPFSEVFEMINPDKNTPENGLQVLTELATDPVLRESYFQYVKEGVSQHFDNLKDYLNPSALFLIYGSAKAFTSKYFDKTIDLKNELNSERTMSYENAKLEMLKEYIDDPNIKSLNAHDSYRYAKTFNDTLYEYKNKNRETITAKIFDFFSDFSKGVFKVKNKLTNNENEEGLIADLLEEYNTPKSVDARFKRLGLDKDVSGFLLNQDTQTVADNLNSINKKSIVGAYKQSILDQNLLSFAVFANDYNERLKESEELKPSEKRQFKEKIKYFSDFINDQDKTTGHKLFKDNKLSPELNLMKETITDLKENKYDNNYDIQNFLNKTAPHLILINDSDFLKIAELPFSYYFQKEVDKNMINKMKEGVLSEKNELNNNKDNVEKFDEKYEYISKIENKLNSLKNTLNNEDVREHYIKDYALDSKENVLFKIKKANNDKDLFIELSGVDTFVSELQQRQKIKKLLVDNTEDDDNKSQKLRDAAKNKLK